jgi:hypothetical protein
MIPRIILPIILAFALCSSAFVPHAGARERARIKARPKPTPETIESISTDSITVNEAGGAKTYKITQDTEITYQGDTVSVGQLQTGMRVEVTPDALYDGVAGLIQADEAPAAAKAPARK